jgi:hypothetical protein
VEDYKMRQLCKCGCDMGYVENKNGQNVVRCKLCNKAVYNAPKNEIDASLSLRKVIPDRQKVRIFERDGYRCIVCGRSPGQDGAIVLHIAHIISIKDADKIKKHYGVAARDWVNDDINLFTCCEECNLSQGGDSLIPKVAVFVSALITSGSTK